LAIEAEEGSDGQERDYAGYLLRRLVEPAGWSASRAATIPSSSSARLCLHPAGALRAIQEQKPKEFTGQLYAAHQLLTTDSQDFSPSLALTQAYENVRQVVRA